MSVQIKKSVRRQPKPRKNPTFELLRGEATRQQIKLAARKLFAMRGLEAVSIREIVKAAGQRNAGSINYYFQSKEELVKELIADTAKLLDDDHNRRLDLLERENGPRSIHEVVDILIHYPTIDEPGEVRDTHALRFLNMIMINHRDLVFEALQGGIDKGTRRCMMHLRRFAPDLPPVVIQQRLMLIIIYLFAAASSREASRENPRLWRNLWGHPVSRQNLIDTVEGILMQPPSAETLAQVQKATSTSARVHAARRPSPRPRVGRNDRARQGNQSRA